MLNPDDSSESERTQKKAQLLARFSAYLDANETASSEQQGETVDLYRLFTELAALKAEVKTESRQLKSALDEFKTVTDLLQRNNEQLTAELAERRQASNADQQRIEQPLLLELLELRDRIEAGVNEASTAPTGWFKRNAQQRHASALHEGMTITLRRLDAALSRYQVSPIETQGLPFDPLNMNVVGTQHQPEHDEGTVLTEQRKGYRRHDTLYRVAEVIVNKKEEK
ncbi:hypothetical protein MNBD_GAMMA17-831 [hydrothermal vent metagenome]|uniref:Heat shock protein GrpE n=1 Tax=hydrothermal vent metagenome TaxID=652676 RepID=A0A3B0ZV53_9ZZZZ